MIAIMEAIQKYVPLHSEKIEVEIPSVGKKQVTFADRFHHLLFGGDMLTAKRARGSKNIRSNSAMGSDRMEGLLPVVEDWHTKVCLIGVSLVYREIESMVLMNKYYCRLYGSGSILVLLLEIPITCTTFALY